MALDSYANLKTEVENWSHRDDVGTKLDLYIDLAEAKMLNNDREPIKVLGQEAIDGYTYYASGYAIT